MLKAKNLAWKSSKNFFNPFQIGHYGNIIKTIRVLYLEILLKIGHLIWGASPPLVTFGDNLWLKEGRIHLYSWKTSSQNLNNGSETIPLSLFYFKVFIDPLLFRINMKEIIYVYIKEITNREIYTGCLSCYVDSFLLKLSFDEAENLQPALIKCHDMQECFQSTQLPHLVPWSNMPFHKRWLFLARPSCMLLLNSLVTVISRL